MKTNKSHPRITTPTPLHGRILERYGSIREFSRRVGTSRPHLYGILRGHSSPSLDLASTLARHLGLTLDEFYLLIARPEAPIATTSALKK